jgi:hypothetical protein
MSKRLQEFILFGGLNRTNLLERLNFLGLQAQDGIEVIEQLLQWNVYYIAIKLYG